MACTGFAALYFGVNLRLVLLVDGSGLEQLAAWAEELWKPRNPSQVELALPDTPSLDPAVVLPRPVGLWGQGVRLSWPSGCPRTSGCSPLSQDLLGWKRPLGSLSLTYYFSTLQLACHCQVQFISTVPGYCKGLVWTWLKPSRRWLAVSLVCYQEAWQVQPVLGTWAAGWGGMGVGRGCPSHLPVAFWCQWAVDVHLGVSYPQHSWRSGQQRTGVKRNGSCCHPAPDVIQPWDNLPRSFSSLHGLVLLVLNPCRACAAQWNVAVGIQTCLDS